MTAASYIGKFGKEIEKISDQLIEHNLAHFIASDAHNNTNRLFHMKEAMEKLEKDFGPEKVQQKLRASLIWRISGKKPFIGWKLK